ncbi:basic proline-rich protein-like [Entelurus aequoreus]|uniref:basic proline-rich protein-like n=1 Tax=Entelurus aequoreus TaxID=161455 RepID=UPI002B1DB858|nr:basic proline-rich protein-like [Entelurus aequoreus]
MQRNVRKQLAVCAGARVRPQPPRESIPQTVGVVPREPGATAPTQPSRTATGTPEPGPPRHPQGPAAGRRQTHPAEDKAQEKQGAARPQASERPHPTRTERRDAPPEGPGDPPQPDGKTAPAPPATGPPRAPPPLPESAARPAHGHHTQAGRHRTTQHGATGTTHPTRRDPNDGDGTTSNRPAESPPEVGEIHK